MNNPKPPCKNNVKDELLPFFTLIVQNKHPK